ncbi:uncharacterized protein [Amphiura filiformis]|uniref:uncharacterized protein n=1 Tax=Amphiura filiformis TaxID=82378 RepID=UPI003B219CE9
MDEGDGNWQDQPPVNVRVPYSTVSWAPAASWVRDDEAQTLSLHELVREVLVTMVLDRLKSKGLPPSACCHTKGLQLDTIISGIVDSHSVMCAQSSKQLQEAGDTVGISLQDHDDDSSWEVQRVSHMMDELTAALNSSSVTPTQHNVPTMQTPARQAPRPKQQVQHVIAENQVETSGLIKRSKKQSPEAVNECQTCSKIFSSSKELKRHQVVHTVERPFKCEKCDMTFKAKRALTRHFRRVHLNKRQFCCKICGKGMRKSDSHNFCTVLVMASNSNANTVIKFWLIYED